jgi:RNA-binding protein
MEVFMLKGKQKRFLRSKAHHLSPIFQVGKGGVNENMIQQISDALEARELLKVSILQNCEEDRNTVAEQLAKGARAQVVQVIGNTIILYKESRENKQIVLPR